MSEVRFWVLVKDNIVVNSIVWDGVSSWTPPDDHELVETTGMENAPGPDWLYEGGIFTPSSIPEEPIE
jgi:hypothetical protein